MSSATAISMYTLPIQTRPGYSARIAMDRLIVNILRVEKILTPSFWSKIFGGTSKDYVRATVASSNEEVKAIRKIFEIVQDSVRKQGGNSAVEGSLTRIIQMIDRWGDEAIQFEEAEFGSEQKLLNTTKRLLNLLNDLKDPASGLY